MSPRRLAPFEPVLGFYTVTRADEIPFPHYLFGFDNADLSNYDGVPDGQVAADWRGFLVNEKPPIGQVANAGFGLELLYADPAAPGDVWRIVPELCHIVDNAGNVRVPHRAHGFFLPADGEESVVNYDD